MNDHSWGTVYTLNDYQAAALGFRLETSDEQYVEENLVGEVGELFSLKAKARRDGRKFDYDMQYKKELGDIFWSVAVAAADKGWTLQDLANSNIYKLSNRKQQGTLQGSGDNR